MKKIWIVLAIALLHQIAVSGQDLLITTQGDSLNCKITKVKDDYVYFTFSHQGEVRNTLLPRTQVTYYQQSYYNTFEVLPHQIAGYKPEFQHWRLAFNAGWSYRTAPLADNLSSAEKEYMKKLKSGFAISADATYFFTEMFGAGMKYDVFRSSHSESSVSDKISIPFIGPTFAMRFYDHKKSNCWYMDFAIGYMGFKNTGEGGGMKGTRKGSTVGCTWDAGYDIALSKNWSAGIQLSLLAGLLTEYKETLNGVTQTIKLEKDYYEGLGRLNISVGLRCNL